MSRICVKNLPKHIAEDRLRDIFSQKGEITDAKLMRFKDGRSRQFAFIGFRTGHEAQEAIKYFNKSYLDTSRIFCEIAHKVGDPNTPRPWSRHSVKKQDKVMGKDEKSGAKSLSAAGVKGEKKNRKNTSDIDDPQLKEFLEVMQPRVKSKMWSNDMSIAPATEQINKVSEEVLVKKVNDQVISNRDEPDEAKIASDDLDIKQDEDITHDEDISDMDYFKSRIKKNWLDSESDSDVDHDGHEAGDDHAEDDDDSNGDGDFDDAATAGGDDDGEANNHYGGAVSGDGDNAMQAEADGKTAQDLKDDKEIVLETGRLFVRNLPYAATEDELREHFGEYGEISEVHLVLDRETKRSKGIAYILYTVPESATRALEELDNSIFQGRLLHVLPAKHRESSDKQVTDTSTAPKTFKQKREEERKASEASGDTKAWNSLFMRPDTILENIVRSHGVSKSDLLDRESDDPAVRLALGETKVIAETKKALTDAGVNVASLEEFATGKADGKKRSNHILLVKNLPFASSEKELAKMFGKFGNLDKVILPPTRTLALVVFLEPSEARASFKGLAYKRYKDAPLCLEWAPGDIFDQKTPPENDAGKNAIGEHDVKRVILEQQVEGITNEIDPDRNESRILHVKNLNFKTSDESLKKHFTELVKQGKILSVRIIKHMKNGKNLSSGYGFIEFDTADTATNVYRDLQGTVLDGHALILRFCETKKSNVGSKGVDKDKQSTKLHVKNIAFEATEKDLRQLFSPFGQIKSLRLPRKFGQQHRGYAFVEFVTKQEALNAMKALSSTHLYGRHLLLEWAEDDESLEAIRARSAAKLMEEQSVFDNPGKVSKKRKRMAVLDESKMKFERIATD